MSDRRASSLRAASLLSPQQPVTTFFPWTAARPFLAQDKKVVPWLPSTACRPLRGAGRSSPVCRQPSRPRWARPGKLKRTRQWRPSAPSPRTATASPARSAPSPSTSRPSWSASRPLRKGPALPHLRRQRRTGRGLAEDRQGHRARLPLGQAGRPELPGSDLRHPDRGGRRGRPPAHLVPPEPGLTTPTQRPRRKAGLSSREDSAAERPRTLATCGALIHAALTVHQLYAWRGVVGGAGCWGPEVDAFIVSCSFWMRARISSNGSGLSSNIIGAIVAIVGAQILDPRLGRHQLQACPAARCRSWPSPSGRRSPCAWRPAPAARNRWRRPLPSSVSSSMARS